jgi:hypothetical protein
MAISLLAHSVDGSDIAGSPSSGLTCSTGP